MEHPCKDCACSHPQGVCTCKALGRHRYNVDPELGMGVTIYVGSDRYAGTIVRVSENLKRVWIRRDISVRTDGRGPHTEEQEHRHEPDLGAAIEVFSRRKSGRWIQSKMRSGCSLSLGFRDAYMDPSF